MKLYEKSSGESSGRVSQVATDSSRYKSSSIPEDQKNQADARANPDMTQTARSIVNCSMQGFKWTFVIILSSFFLKLNLHENVVDYFKMFLLRAIILSAAYEKLFLSYWSNNLLMRRMSYSACYVIASYTSVLNRLKEVSPDFVKAIFFGHIVFDVFPYEAVYRSFKNAVGAFTRWYVMSFFQYINKDRELIYGSERLTVLYSKSGKFDGQDDRANSAQDVAQALNNHQVRAGKIN